MNESVKSTHACQRRIRRYLFRALTNSIVEVAPSLPLVTIGLARDHQKSKIFRYCFWAMSWFKIVHALPDARVDISQDGGQALEQSNEKCMTPKGCCALGLEPPHGLCRQEVPRLSVRSGKTCRLDESDVKQDWVARYEPLSDSGRRFTGMTRCFLASSSTIRDLPIPDDWTIGTYRAYVIGSLFSQCLFRVSQRQSAAVPT